MVYLKINRANADAIMKISKSNTRSTTGHIFFFSKIKTRGFM